MVVYAINVILYQEILERSSEFERSMELIDTSSSRSDSVASKASVRSIEEHNLEESKEGDNRRLSTSELAISDSNTSINLQTITESENIEVNCPGNPPTSADPYINPHRQSSNRK